VSDAIFSKLGINLHLRPNHPLGILKEAIHDYFEQREPGKFQQFDKESPIVTVKAVSKVPWLLLDAMDSSMVL
jgi:phenylalanyl-tRNA synthetase alpha chain